MSINNTYTNVARLVSHINNPSKRMGTLLEEIPCDIGRSKESYDRGGLLEGAERLRKEVMAAMVWLFGIPIFKNLGDGFCENILKLPMKMDFCDATKGNDSIGDTIKFMTGQLKETAKDTSEITQEYIKKFKFKPDMSEADIAKLIKNVRGAKKVTSIMALVVNGALMGFILPKINQAITRKNLNKINKANFDKNFIDFNSFKNQTKKPQENKNKNINFGMNLDDIVYLIDNSATFGLVATDVPTVTGRVITSRNKFEAMENFVLDVGSIYFYNFISKHVQSILRNFSKNPDIDPKAAEDILNFAQSNMDKIKEAFENLDENSTLKDILPQDMVEKIYDVSTYGKYKKINSFVKKEDIENIDKNVINFFKKIKEQAPEDLTYDKLKELTKKINNKNALFLATGLLSSIVGLSVIMPKFTFWLSEKITGKREFTGIADYNDKKSNKS